MKIVLQDGIKDCGICCLLSIIRFYGGDVSKEYLREITNTTKDGVSFYNLVIAAEMLGFKANALSGKIEEINVNNLPCIVHFIVKKSYHHFVVLYSVNKKKRQVILMDPAKGKKVISFSEFNLLTSNNYLFLTPQKPIPIIKRKNVIYKTIRKTISQNKKMLIFIAILTLTYFTLNILISFHFKYLLEYSINYNITSSIIYISYIMLAIYALKNANNILRNILLNKWSSAFDYETMTTTYRQILLLPYLYYKNRTTGEVVSRFKDLGTVRNFLINLFCTLVTDLISLLIFGTLLYYYNKKLSLIIFFLSLILFFLTTLFGIKKRKLGKSISKAEDNINSTLIEGISNVDTIKGSHLEKRLIDKFSLKYKSFLELLYNYNFYFELYNYLKSNLNDLIIIIIYALGSYYVITTNFKLNNLIIYQMLFSYYLTCFYNLLNLSTEYNSFKISLERIEDIFLINEEVFKNNYFYLPYNLSGDIIITNLNYMLGTRPLFKNLNLHIKKGEKILLSGESGSGKSTLVKMLMRYIETSFGTIKIAGIDINHYHLENLRTNITYVTSNEYLFTDTIKNNILLYKEISDEEFQRVCNLCLVNDIIKDDSTNYNKLVEENGFNLSNGERQRIILARSLLRKSNIYIFDEALSQIDINREKKILENIFNYYPNKTIIIISHRFNNKKLFDRALKLTNGEIDEKEKL